MEIIDLPAPDTTPEVERKSLREQSELSYFSEEHYMADLMQLECTEPYITYTPEWDTLQKDQVAFNEAEVDLLKELPNKEYLLDPEEEQKLCLNVVDILYASCYDHRTTLGESTMESSWTINKLSSTLCWFQVRLSINEMLFSQEREREKANEINFYQMFSEFYFCRRSYNSVYSKIALLSTF